MKNGDTRRNRLSRKSMWNCSMLAMPPIPTPTMTPTRSSLAGVTRSPDWATAIRAAAIANWMNGSIFLMSRRSMKSSGAKSWTSPAMRDGKSATGKRVIGPMPERPAIRAVQFFSTPVPSGVTRPTPVTTTRRRPFCASFPTNRRMLGRPSKGVKVKRASRTRLDAALACVVFLAGFAVYANTLGHRFVWDDLIVLDSRVRFYRSPLDAFIEPADLRGFPGVFRPLTFSSFWLDQRLWWRTAFGFHLTSVLLHALNGVLVFGLARVLGCAALAAAGGALLFAVHPVHTEAVAWVSGRVDVLATTFALLAVVIALRQRSRGGVAAAITVGLCAFAAAASKEIGRASCRERV